MDNLIEFARAVLSTTPARWKDLTEKVPVELLTRPPRPKEWSALQCLEHLIETEQLVFPVRLRAFLEGSRIADFDPDHAQKRARGSSPRGLASRFAADRADNLKLLDKITPKDLTLSSAHSALGTVTLGEMLHEWAGHDLMHTVQAERAIMQPFIAGTGPWRGTFADHDVEPKGKG